MNIGFPSLLTLIFITLKLTGFIAWSWTWVLAPVWISALAAIIVFSLTVLALAWKESGR